MKPGSLPGNARTGRQSGGLAYTESSFGINAKLVMWAFHIVLALSLLGVTAVSAQGGQAGLILINFVGTEMIFTLDDTPYVVPGTDTVPEGGELRLTLIPGRHTYSAHAPGSEGTNGEIELLIGQTQILGAHLERSSPVLSPAGLVLEKPQDVLVIFEATLTPPASPTATKPDPLRPLPVGKGALVLVNYIGETLTVDIDGTLYTVPTNGRLQIDLPPGEVTYSVSAGLSGMNGAVQVTVNDYIGVGFKREIPPEEADYEVGEPVPTPVPLEISDFPVSLVDEPVGRDASASAEVASPASKDDESIFTPPGQEVLEVVNYIGEALTFTINNQTYLVAADGGTLTLNVAPGEYTFSASTPQAGMNGSLGVTEGEDTQVGVALDFESGRLKVYTN